MTDGPNRIRIVGVGPDGLAGLAGRNRAALESAQVVYGSEAALSLLPELGGERVAIGTDLPATVERLRAGLGRVTQAIAAVGDPLFYGTAKYLCDKLGAAHFEVLPHVSSMQLAFARLKLSWEEAYLGDLGSKPLEEVVARVRTAQTVGLFTTDEFTPARLARELLARGIDYFDAAVCENLGGRDERLTRGQLGELRHERFEPLNVVVLTRRPGRADALTPVRPLARFGNPDELFAQSRPKSALVTQAEVRALALAKLDLQVGDVAWDVGAGTGSVALEMAQLVGVRPTPPAGQSGPGVVYAIEHDPADFPLIVANAERFGVANVRPVFGSAPAVFAGLPSPDAIFVGGNGGEVARLLELSYAALKPGGRLAVHVGTLEMIGATHAVLKRLSPAVEALLVSFARGVEQLESLRFEAVNPTVLFWVRKPA